MIRDATPADAPLLESIQRASLASPWPELLDSAVHGGVDCLVATTATDTPVGYAIFVDGEAKRASKDVDEDARGHDRESEAEPRRGKQHEQCYLAELAVSPSHRREGYGSSLLETVIERTDADELLLTARVDATTATEFYETHGFRVIDRLPDHYEETETETRDGLLLSKSLEH